MRTCFTNTELNFIDDTKRFHGLIILVKFIRSAPLNLTIQTHLFQCTTRNYSKIDQSRLIWFSVVPSAYVVLMRPSGYSLTRVPSGYRMSFCPLAYSIAFTPFFSILWIVPSVNIDSSSPSANIHFIVPSGNLYRLNQKVRTLPIIMQGGMFMICKIVISRQQIELKVIQIQIYLKI